MKTFRQLSYPYLIWMTLLIVLPNLLIILYAFTQPGNEVVPIQFTLENFIKFLDPLYISVLGKSLWVAFQTTLICLLIGYPTAYAISRQKQKHQLLIILLITMPTWVNMLIRTYSWISLLSDTGIINNLLGAIGLGPIKMMYTDFAVILGMVYNFLPFMILSIYTQLAKMDESLIDAAHDLGATKAEVFRKVTFPLSIPGILTGITLVFLPAVSSFVIPKLLGGGSYVLIGNLIENQFIIQGQWNFGSAVSLIMTIIILLSMFITRKFDRDIEAENSKSAREVNYAKN